jgi:hypothetical protein
MELIGELVSIALIWVGPSSVLMFQVNDTRSRVTIFLKQINSCIDIIASKGSFELAKDGLNFLVGAFVKHEISSTCLHVNR